VTTNPEPIEQAPPAEPGTALEQAAPPRQSQAAIELRARMDFAQAMAQAGNLPPSYRKQPANLLLADQYARDLALPFTTILTGIHVIEGKPSASAGLISGLVRRAGHRLRVTVDRDDQGRPVAATATIIRGDDPDFTFTATFTLADAATAGLCDLKNGRPFARSDKGKVLPWEAYPEAMMKARAVTAVARDACQDALFGLQYTPEELGAVVDEDGAPVEGPPANLRPISAAPQPAPAEPPPGRAPAAQVIDGEIVDPPAPAAPPAEPAIPEQPVETTEADTQRAAAERRAGQALVCGDLDELRDHYKGAQEAGLLAVDVLHVLERPERLAMGIRGQVERVPLQQALMACAAFVKQHATSVADFLDKAEPEPAEPGDEPGESEQLDLDTE
jgi:hypothetical protein